MRSPATIEAFDAECTALSAIVQVLPPEDLARPTNCPPWTLHELIVHIADSISTPEAGFREASDDLPPGTAADYYRRPERDTTEYRTSNVERARERATVVTVDAVAARFVDAWGRTSRAVRSSDLARRVDGAGRALTLDDYLLTRLMSVAAHGVDVAISLGRAPWTTPSALAALRPVLVDLLEATPPARWSDQDLLEIGTGRRRLGPADRRALGPVAARFPLLS